MMYYRVAGCRLVAGSCIVLFISTPAPAQSDNKGRVNELREREKREHGEDTQYVHSPLFGLQRASIHRERRREWPRDAVFLHCNTVLSMSHDRICGNATILRPIPGYVEEVPPSAAHGSPMEVARRAARQHVFM
ncbi:hypothetical protein F5Y01DRAFT_282637 [Xylaria sp. FL0043]|nr:hypothetical protein F5Y01DRAFT_282637 [Xylaria sp. FL0043]